MIRIAVVPAIKLPWSRQFTTAIHDGKSSKICVQNRNPLTLGFIFIQVMDDSVCAECLQPDVGVNGRLCWRHRVHVVSGVAEYSETTGLSAEVRVGVCCGNKRALLHLPRHFMIKKNPACSKPYVVAGDKGGAQSLHSVGEFEIIGGHELTKNWMSSFKIEGSELSVGDWLVCSKPNEAAAEALPEALPEDVSEDVSEGVSEDHLLALATAVAAAAAKAEQGKAPKEELLAAQAIYLFQGATDSAGMRAVRLHLQQRALAVTPFQSEDLCAVLREVVQSVTVRAAPFERGECIWDGVTAYAILIRGRVHVFKLVSDTELFTATVAAMRVLLSAEYDAYAKLTSARAVYNEAVSEHIMLLN